MQSAVHGLDGNDIGGYAAMKITREGISFEATDGGELHGYWPQVNAGKWEPHTYRIFKRFLNKHQSYVDIGAWIGPTVLFGSQLAKHCYAIEPDPIALKMLYKHLRINGIDNVTVSELAISDKTGEMTLGCVRENDARVGLGESMTSCLFGGHAFAAYCLTLETYFKANGITDCNFIKMDIEGAEYLVLPQAVSFLERLGAVLYLSVHPQFLSAEQMKMIADCLWPLRTEQEDGIPISMQDVMDGKASEFLVFF